VGGRPQVSAHVGGFPVDGISHWVAGAQSIRTSTGVCCS